MFSTPAFAQTDGGSGDLLFSLLPFLLIFVIIYFLIIRPQQRKQKEHQAMISAVRRGDRVMMAGGLLGKVTRVSDEDDIIKIEIAQGVEVEVSRTLVSSVMAKGSPAKEEKKKAK